jgi:hypothetical protein
LLPGAAAVAEPERRISARVDAVFSNVGGERPANSLGAVMSAFFHRDIP